MTESDRERVLSAIDDLGKVVTVADVTSATGFSIPRTRQLLNEIALSNGGRLQVHEGGQIAYCFDNLDKAGLHPNIATATAAMWRQTVHIFLKGLNLFVGIGLFLCLGFVFGVCLTTVSLIAYLIWRANTYISTMRNKQPEQSLGECLQQLWRKAERFFLNCHHFVLGPGNPNSDLEERRWHLLAELIREQEGVLVYEQLAPFSIGRFNPKSEDAILSLLLRFNGDPQVSATGNIVYTFPDLISTGISQKHFAEHCLQERQWKFFDRSPRECLSVAMIILLNVAALSVVPLIIQMQFVFHPIWQILSWYGTALVLIPVVRCLAVTICKIGVFQRNAWRRRQLNRIEHPTRDLSLKLAEAKEHCSGMTVVTAEPVVYDTFKDLIEQQIDTKPV